MQGCLGTWGMAGPASVCLGFPARGANGSEAGEGREVIPPRGIKKGGGKKNKKGSQIYASAISLHNQLML